ncbi:SDR family oxidoreductase [Streptomyces sp. NPDC006923]|uniref:SDR family oxidoreductase n=1 Tax=Streptomyces sp. NPDC006923 TaxID=3155355 RepID=UPI0033C29420
MTVDGASVFITGAGRGLGRVFAKTMVEHGAAVVYGAARDETKVDEPGVVPVRLDVTKPGEVAEAAAMCGDVDILINNAAVMRKAPLLSAPTLDDARQEMETNYFGTAAMCRAFAPVLARNGGGALVNMLSVVSWFANPFNSSYGASKSAAWALTNAARVELRHQGTLVTGVFAGFIDTDMAALASASASKITPESVAEQVVSGIEAGREEVLTDDFTRTVKASLPDDLTLIYSAQQADWDSGVWA